ncbi:MAG TPA: Fe-S cluster assembly protein SufB, partial [Corynebacterium nuruki]|nr:Fe-S cluster assembly protein SufB [Corynebacterium nuruki]
MTQAAQTPPSAVEEARLAKNQEKLRADDAIVDSMGGGYEYGWHDSDAAGKDAQ